METDINGEKWAHQLIFMTITLKSGTEAFPLRLPLVILKGRIHPYRYYCKSQQHDEECNVYQKSIPKVQMGRYYSLLFFKKEHWSALTLPIGSSKKKINALSVSCKIIFFSLK